MFFENRETLLKPNFVCFIPEEVENLHEDSTENPDSDYTEIRVGSVPLENDKGGVPVDLFFIKDADDNDATETATTPRRGPESQQFEVKDFGELKYCQGIEFRRLANDIAMHQKGYVFEVLKSFDMSESKPVNTLLNVNTKLMRLEAPQTVVVCCATRLIRGYTCELIGKMPKVSRNQLAEGASRKDRPREKK
ncbi:hypothetical protein M0804_013364 [Polistes exclamans]|nr:hypothetical protein M0804_013364 [Polistes exclamans]